MEWKSKESQKNYEMSVEKWDDIVKKLENVLQPISGDCGHCKEFGLNPVSVMDCAKCPLFKVDYCRFGRSPSVMFHIIQASVRDALKNSHLMLTQIIATKSAFMTEEKKEEEKTYYHIGQRFGYNGDIYLLSWTRDNFIKDSCCFLCCLINIRNGDAWIPPIRVADATCITEEEMASICGGNEFRLIKEE